MKIQNREVSDALHAVRVLLAGTYSIVTHLKLLELERELAQRFQDIEELRVERLRMQASIDPDTGEVVFVDGKAVFPTPDARDAFFAEIAPLGDAEFEVSTTLTPADFRRREKDEAGRSFETDAMDGDIVRRLRPLLTQEV